MAKIACTWENGRKRAKDGLGGGVIRKQVEDIGSVGGSKLGGVRGPILDGKRWSLVGYEGWEGGELVPMLSTWSFSAWDSNLMEGFG